MRGSSIATFIFAVINLACIVVLVWLNRNADSFDQHRKDVLKKHLRLSNDFMPPITENEYYANEKRFSVVIVTHQEILEKTPRRRLQEIVIVDDVNTPPITWNPDPSRVRIVRSDERLGLIRARILGGNSAKGDFIVFLDAHCRVSPRWLETPYKLLMENNKTIVNFVDFILDENFNVKPASVGIGSSATIYTSLRQYWGGGSRKDDFTPITMGMFATTRYWWSMGQMDPALQIWGGENVEISFRTWLCGGRIMVARDSYVAHYFRTKPTYTYDASLVTKNYVRIAHTWLDEPSLRIFYKAHGMKYEQGKMPDYVGDISDRLKLKEELQCKPFSAYLDMFKGRAFCDTKDKTCGNVYAVTTMEIKQSEKEIFD